MCRKLFVHTHLALCMYVCTACTSVFVGTTCALFFTLTQMFERKKKPFKVIVEGVGGWALCSKTQHICTCFWGTYKVKACGINTYFSCLFTGSNAPPPTHTQQRRHTPPCIHRWISCWLRFVRFSFYLTANHCLHSAIMLCASVFLYLLLSSPTHFLFLYQR